MGAKEEFKKHWVLYLVFHLAGGTLGLINRLEGSFARTLVECDTPLSQDSFTGSRWCGDRLLVINEGQVLSSFAQSQESVSKVVAMLFVAVMCDVIGRRPAVVLGLTCTAMSVVLFFVAAMLPAWISFKLFIVGQTLQGFFAADLLSTIVVTDVMNAPDTDKLGAGQANMIIGMLVQIVVQITSLSLNSLELVDYRPLWFMVLLVNVPLTVVAAFKCEETKPGKPSASEHSGGLFAAVGEEVTGYGRLFIKNSFLRMLLLSGALATASETVASIEQSFYMAHLGASQARVALVWWIETVFFALLLGCADKVRKRYGVRKTWLLLFCSRGGLDILCLPLLPLHSIMLPAKKYCKAFWSGAGGLQDAVSAGYFDSSITVKYLAMRKLAEHAANIASLPTYAYLFNAKAETYVGKLAPFSFQVLVRILHFIVVFGFCWDAGADGGISQSLAKLEKSSEAPEEPAAKDGKLD